MVRPLEGINRLSGFLGPLTSILALILGIHWLQPVGRGSTYWLQPVTVVQATDWVLTGWGGRPMLVSEGEQI